MHWRIAKSYPAARRVLVAFCLMSVAVRAGQQANLDPLSISGILNGQPRLFTLDTGNEITMISLDAQSEQLQYLAKSHGGGAVDDDVCDLVKVDQISFASAIESNVAVRRCKGGNNLLGIDRLNKKIFALKFSARELTFLNSVPDQVQMTPLDRDSGGAILLPVEVAGISTKALFDSGASTTTVSSKVIALHPDRFTFVREIQSQDIDGNSMALKMYMVSDLKIGSLDLKDQVVVGLDFPNGLYADDVQSVIGLSAMQNANWLFDLKNNTWSWDQNGIGESWFQRLFDWL